MDQTNRPPNGADELGKVANQLRQYICDAMLDRETIREVLPYFDEMSGAQTVSLRQYQRWVSRLRNHEFADEWVLAITAKKLRIPIIVVPKESAWVLQTHPDPTLHGLLSVEANHPIYLGNDDVHYVYLHKL